MEQFTADLTQGDLSTGRMQPEGQWMLTSGDVSEVTSSEW